MDHIVHHSKNGEFSMYVLKQQIHITSVQEYHLIVALKTPFTRRYKNVPPIYLLRHLQSNLQQKKPCFSRTLKKYIRMNLQNFAN